METTIRTKKTGAGHAEITVTINPFQTDEHSECYETTDMELVADISVFNNQERMFESDMTKFDDYDELISWCLNKAFGANTYDGIISNVGYLIMDSSCDEKNYINESGCNTGDPANCARYATKEDAQKIIDENNWGDWAYIGS